MSSGRVLAMELVAEDAISKWRRLIGEMDILADRVRCRDTHTPPPARLLQPRSVIVDVDID
jgi:hypothetical protein